MDMSNCIRPKVSVRLMTYNHEPFIRQAMDGIMMQRTDFLVEVVVGDDFSSDRTLEIIKEYRDLEHIRIKILNRTIGDDYWNERQVKGRIYNFVNILENCTGDFIAILDGDDYWTDPLKLQKQVALLESNPDVVISFHNISITSNGKMKRAKLMDLFSGNFFSIDDLAIAGITIPTLSVVFRNKITDDVLEVLSRAPTGDIPLWLLLTKDGGRLHYDNEIMAVYRIHEGGIWSGKKTRERMMMLNESIQTVKPCVDDKIQKLLELQCNKLYENALIDCVDDEILFREMYLKYSKKIDNQLIEFFRSEIKSRALLNELNQIKKSKYFQVYFLIKKVYRKIKK